MQMPALLFWFQGELPAVYPSPWALVPPAVQLGTGVSEDPYSRVLAFV